MNKFILACVILFVCAYVGKQSNFVVTTKQWDARIGINVEETHLSWDNLYGYFGKIAQDVSSAAGKIIPSKKR
ncbi:MAG: hypothetical protein WC676_04650 [Candidatus Omnitrophota bacterium]